MRGLLENNLVLRILSALVLIPVTLFAVYQGGVVFTAFLVFLFSVCLYECIQLARKVEPMLIWGAAGALYLALSFVSFFYLRIDLFAAILFVAMVWSSDIGAYVFGKFIGGAKMVPSISPNKTWAGLVGALVFPSLAFIGVAVFSGQAEGVDWGAGGELARFILSALLMGGGIGLSGQVGDLSVSILKRKAGEKDTGAIIPGHGGLLDRMDSMLLSGIVMAVALYVFG